MNYQKITKVFFLFRQDSLGRYYIFSNLVRFQILRNINISHFLIPFNYYHLQGGSIHIHPFRIVYILIICSKAKSCGIDAKTNKSRFKAGKIGIFFFQKLMKHREQLNIIIPTKTPIAWLSNL